MTRQLILLLTIAILMVVSCRPPGELSSESLPQKNKDVLILATLISNRLRQTNDRSLKLEEIVKNDTLKRITNNFQSLAFVSKGGYISVYYKFSEARDTSNIKLTDSEKKRWVKWASGKIQENYNGEIRVAYGEKFYHLKKIVVKE